MTKFPSASVHKPTHVTASCPLTIDIAAAIERQRCNRALSNVLGIGRRGKGGRLARVGHAPFLANATRGKGIVSHLRGGGLHHFGARKKGGMLARR